MHAYSFTLVASSYQSSLSNDLWKNKEFTDVVLDVDGEKIPAHKLILATKSPYFRALLYGEMREASQEEVTLPNIPLTPFKRVLEYAYTGKLEIEEPLEVSPYTFEFPSRDLSKSW